MKFTGSTGWYTTLAQNRPARSSGSEAETEAKSACSKMKQRKMRCGFGPSGMNFATATPLAVVAGPLSLFAREGLPDRVGTPPDLAVGHFLSHEKQEPTVTFLNTTHQPAELVQKTSLFPGPAPNNIVGTLALRKIGEFGWFFSVIEQLIKGDFQSAGHFFECFNGRNRMAVFHA